MTGKKENLEYVDLIKGFAALSVVLLHAFPKQVLYATFAEVHIWQAVPLFVFVSFFLIYRKMEYCEEYYSRGSFVKLFKKILVPFVLLQLVFIFVCVLKGNITSIKNLVVYGGYGRGSYYVYIYIYRYGLWHHCYISCLKRILYLQHWGLLLLRLWGIF